MLLSPRAAGSAPFRIIQPAARTLYRVCARLRTALITLVLRAVANSSSDAFREACDSSTTTIACTESFLLGSIAAQLYIKYRRACCSACNGTH